MYPFCIVASLRIFLLLSAVRALLTLQQQLRLINDKKDDGFTALHLAALNNHTEIAELLVKQVRDSFDILFRNFRLILFQNLFPSLLGKRSQYHYQADSSNLSSLGILRYGYRKGRGRSISCII